MRRLLSCALLSAMLWGCQKTNPHPMDPFEGVNREIYALNKTLDKAVVRPVAYAYWKYLPTPFQMGIGNFYDNLREISNIANDILQGKLGYASHDASRFFINSTLGLGGFFDVAGNLGLMHRREDFGQTLYIWGYECSAYIVLPLLGPSTIRDTAGLVVDYYAFSVWPWIGDDEWRYGLLTLDLIDLRARLLRHDTVLSTVAVDEYAFMRDAYFQRRLYLINNEFDNDADGDGTADLDPYDASNSSSDAKLSIESAKTKNDSSTEVTVVKDLPAVKEPAVKTTEPVKDSDLPDPKADAGKTNLKPATVKTKTDKDVYPLKVEGASKPKAEVTSKPKAESSNTQKISMLKPV